MKLKLDIDEVFFEAFITFSEAEAARSAHNSNVGSRYITKLLSIKNINNSESDYIPSLYMGNTIEQPVPRKKPAALWHVATYKEGRENMLKGSRCLQRKIGHIPRENMKKYEEY